jgi:hypothetical protein
MFRKLKEQKQEEERKLEQEVLDNQRKKEEYQSSLKKAREIASDYLLTTSAEGYATSAGKELSDFSLRSVDGVFLGNSDLEGTISECKRQMIEKAQGLGAEVVTDVKPAISYHKCHYQPVYIMGTALIPKQQK